MTVREPSFLREIENQIQSVRDTWRTQALVLGGSSGSGGGSGSPVGGIQGQLAQKYVAEDEDELSTLSTGSAPSLLDNLNHIRYWEDVQISATEPSPTFAGQLWVDESSGSVLKVRNESDAGWITVASGGGGGVLDGSSPQDVGASAVVGSSGSAAHGNHVHRGVTGIYTAPNTNAYGDVELVGSPNLTVTQSSGSFTFATSGSFTPSVHGINGAYHTGFPLTAANGGTGLANSYNLTIAGTASISGTNTGDNAVNSLYSGFIAEAGSSLTIATGVALAGMTSGSLAVGAGQLSSTSPNDISSGSHTHQIDSSLARSAITVTGSGALGGGGALTSNQAITLNTPGTLNVSSTNSSASAHTHAITSGSAPGAAASLLSTSSDGYINVTRLGVGIAPTTPLQIDYTNTDYTNTAGANSHILLTNSSATGQTSIDAIINGSFKGKWRADYVGTVTYSAYDSHKFRAGGDYPVGTEVFILDGFGVTIPLTTLRFKPSNYVGSLSWTPTGSDKTVTIPDLTGTVALGAGSLSVSSTNSVSVASHTHAITSGSAPGAAASLLATDASGNLTLAGQLKVTTAISGYVPFVTYGIIPNGMTAIAVPFHTAFGYDGTIRRVNVAAYVSTTNNGSNYWTVVFKRLDNDGALVSFDTSAKSANTWESLSSTGLSTAITTSMKGAYVIVDKVGSPGALSLSCPAMYVE